MKSDKIIKCRKLTSTVLQVSIKCSRRFSTQWVENLRFYFLGPTIELYHKNLTLRLAHEVNTAMLEFYWEMGRDISALYEQATYGSAFFDCLSLDLKAEFPDQTGFSSANIRYTKRWYEFYNQNNTNLQQVVEDFKMPADVGLVPCSSYYPQKRN